MEKDRTENLFFVPSRVPFEFEVNVPEVSTTHDVKVFGTVNTVRGDYRGGSIHLQIAADFFIKVSEWTDFKSLNRDYEIPKKKRRYLKIIKQLHQEKSFEHSIDATSVIPQLVLSAENIGIIGLKGTVDDANIEVEVANTRIKIRGNIYLITTLGEKTQDGDVFVSGNPGNMETLQEKNITGYVKENIITDVNPQASSAITALNAKAVAQSKTDVVYEKIEVISGKVNETDDKVGSISEKVSETKDIAFEAWGRVGKLGERVDDIYGKTEEVYNKVEKVQGMAGDVQTKVDGMVDVINQAYDKTHSVGQVSNEAVEKIEALFGKTDQVYSKVTESSNRLGDIQNRTDQLADKLGDITNDVTGIQCKSYDTHNKIDIIAGKVSEVYNKITSLFNQVQESYSKAWDAQSRVNETQHKIDSVKDVADKAYNTVDEIYKRLEEMQSKLSKGQEKQYMPSKKQLEEPIINMQSNVEETEQKQPPKKYTGLEGYLVSSPKGQPIANQKLIITLNDKKYNLTTDNTGHFRAAPIAPGKYEVGFKQIPGHRQKLVRNVPVKTNALTNMWFILINRETKEHEHSDY